jgi:hypothetical protein
MVRENNSYNESRFFIFQPIKLDKRLFESLVINRNLKCDNKQKESFLCEYESKFDSFLGVEDKSVNFLIDVNVSVLVANCFQDSWDLFPMGRYYKKDISKIYVKQNSHGYLTIIYDLIFRYDDTFLNSIIDDTEIIERFRSMFVSDVGKPKKAEILMAENKILDWIKKELLCLEIGKTELKIEENSGNILHLFISEANSSKREVQDYFIETSKNTERVLYQDSILEVSNTELYYTGGRIHLVMVKNDNEIYRFVPIHFYAQFLYNFLSRFFEYLENQFNIHLYNDEELLDNREKVTKLISSLSYLRIYNSLFMTKIEDDKHTVFDRIDYHWNLSNLLSTTDLYVKNLEMTLKNTYDLHQMKSSEKQSYLLYIISGLQIIGLIGVWTTVLGIIDGDTNKSSLIKFISELVDKLYLTYIIFVALVIFTIYFFYSYKKRKNIKRKNK